MSKRSVRKGLAAVMCVVLVAAIGLSALFLLAHARHNCAGAECLVCALIHDAQSLLRQPFLFCALLLSLAGLLISRWRMLRAMSAATGYLFTPISQKVRMNN